jgi:hypothetical protein
MDVQYLQRARRLAQAVAEVEAGSAYCVSPGFHEELLDGLQGALCLQKLKAQRVSETDPAGVRFIEGEQLGALYEFFTTLENIMDDA